MKKISFYTLLILLSVGCSKSPNLVGMSDWPEVEKKAKECILDGISHNILESTDMSHLTKEEKASISRFLQRWHYAELRKHPTEFKIVMPDEYTRLLEESLSDEMKKARGDRARWNIQPERVIYCKFENKDEGHESSMQLGLGVFRRDGLWYFCCSM